MQNVISFVTRQAVTNFRTNSDDGFIAHEFGNSCRNAGQQQTFNVDDIVRQQLACTKSHSNKSGRINVTNEQAVGVILRLIGFWLLLTSLLILIGIAPVTLSSSDALAAAILPLAWLCFGVWLSWRPEAVARMLLPGNATDQTTASWSLDEFQAVLFSALGLYFLVTTLTDLAGWLRVWSTIQSTGNPAQSTDFFGLSQIGSIALRLVAGVWLLLGARGLRSAVSGMRNLGAGR